jgi:cob(I)alamin adenosyltransferase
MRTFNRKGDGGETSLLYGERVAKSDPRCEAYGAVDEAVSALGLARHFCLSEVKDIILSLQRDLFVVGAVLATPVEHYSELAIDHNVVNSEMVQRLENMINGFEAKVKMPESFIIPGGFSAGSAALDVARAVIRRLERRVVALKEAGMAENREMLKYLNRLADLIFTLARYEETLESNKDIHA